jgi:hypothetical protein
MTDFLNRTPRRDPQSRRWRGSVGTPTIDVHRAGKALAQPGIDTRFWIGQGTVGFFDDAGEFQAEDPEAIWCDADGCLVSFRLDATGDFGVARWDGVSCGRYGFFLFPIRPGDEIIVAFPNGTLNDASNHIIALKSNRTAQIPDDWNNDRVLLDMNVPMEIRGPYIDISSSNLILNGRIVYRTPEGI